jgi:hypothetical protein
MVGLQSINYKIEKRKLFSLKNCGKSLPYVVLRFNYVIPEMTSSSDIEPPGKYGS